MALNPSALSALIKANMLGGDPNVVDNASLAGFCDAVAAAVVTHITSAGVVIVPALGLVSAAPGSPVTGAAVGTIT